MPELHIDKSEERGCVAVNTGDGWRELAPTAARQLANAVEEDIEQGNRSDTPGARQFVRKLREFADDVEDA